MRAADKRMLKAALEISVSTAIVPGAAFYKGSWPMCGIIGIVGKEPVSEPADRQPQAA
jgi:hypothetical protein